MALQFRRGVEADRTSITPAEGEPIAVNDSGTWKLYIGDGSTAGGHPIGGGSGSASPLTTKGDIWVFGSADARLGVGTAGQYLTPDSSVGAGLKWADLPSAVVSAFSQDVDGAGHRLDNILVVGNSDVPYDLATDPDGLVVSNAATLTHLYNAYYYADLDASLTITLPTPVAGTAPYGQISVSLGDGTVTLTDTVVWGKNDPTEADGTIPATSGDVFTLFYRYDPISAAYVVHVEYIEAGTATGGSQVSYVTGSAQTSNLTNVNKTSFSHTHNYVSTTQNGDTYLLVVFVGDEAANGDYAEDSKITRLYAGTINFGVTVLIGLYKPTQGDLDGGSEALLYTTSHTGGGEVAQMTTFEVTGANTTNPLDSTAQDQSDLDRGSMGPLSVTANGDGRLIVAVGAASDGNTTDVSLSVNALNGYTQIANYAGTEVTISEYFVHVKEVDTGTHDTPSYTISPSTYARINAVVLKP